MKYCIIVIVMQRSSIVIAIQQLASCEKRKCHHKQNHDGQFTTPVIVQWACVSIQCSSLSGCIKSFFIKVHKK